MKNPGSANRRDDAPAPNGFRGRRKRIGLLGGMSWQSSAIYYAVINERTQAAQGGFHSADCLLASVDFAVVEQLQAEGRWDELAALLADRAKGLELAGAEILLICSNTAHRVADQVAEAVSIPLLHIADAAAEAARSAGLASVGLIGTGFTLEDRTYIDHLAARGVSVVLPEQSDRAILDAIIFKELVLGVIRRSSIEQIREISNRLVNRGAQAIVLACTELDLLLSSPEIEVHVPMLSTTHLHAAAALSLAGD